MRACLLLLPVFAMAQEIPIRLTTPVSTRTAKVADPVNAVVIAPVIMKGSVIAAGAIVHGRVEKVAPSSAPDARAALLISFHEIVIDGRPYAMNAVASAVDNARETVDEQGQINGILASETISGELDSGLDKLNEQYSGIASILSAAKNALVKKASADITYPAGVEMTLRLTKPLTVPPARIPEPPAWPPEDRTLLAQLLSREPFQTTAQEPPKPSDLTNLLLVAAEDDLRRAFTDAGWSVAATLNSLSKIETLRALAEDRGYNEAPVSVLFLDGKPPDLVFEKTTDTFAQRHHLRVWRRPFAIGGKPVWAIAATHDTGIDFSEENRTFIHRIDSHIDRERDKVMYDLLFTGRVTACELFDRPQVPRETQNATGDGIETDARIAALRLNDVY